MNKSTNTHKRGLIGFFDVLGYKVIQKNNPIVEAISVVEKIQKVIEKHQSKISPWSEIFGTNFGDHVVISDSIIAFAPFEEDNNDKKQADMFLPFCGEIVNDLFWAGLPVRGALAYGDFFIQKTRSGIYLAGKPIVESHDLANSLELSGCVICQSAEKFLTSQPAFKGSDHFLRFAKHSVPLKNSKQEKLFILNQCAFFDFEPKITRQILRGKFTAFNKPIDPDIERKVVNTWEFFVACKPELASLAEPPNLPICK